MELYRADLALGLMRYFRFTVHFFWVFGLEFPTDIVSPGPGIILADAQVTELMRPGAIEPLASTRWEVFVKICLLCRLSACSHPTRHDVIVLCNLLGA